MFEKDNIIEILSDNNVKNIDLLILIYPKNKL